MAKSVVIVGGGLTGLAAGCYLRMNGYRTTIFEMHERTGGVCTGWARRGYTVDGAMHWLVGTKPGALFHDIWEELGAVQGQTIVDHDEYGRVEGAGGRTLILYADLDRLERHLKELSPADAPVIDDFIRGIRDFEKVYMPVDKAPELYTLWDGLKMMRMLPSLRPLRKWGRVMSRAFTGRFQDPFLREALEAALVGDLDDFPMTFMMMTFAWLDQRMAGYPVGGALKLAQLIEARYRGLGGELACGQAVKQILVENDTAVGVRLADGTEHRADYVVSAADGRTTIFDMLGGKYLDARTRAWYDHPQLFPPLIYVGLGVARPFTDVPPSVTGLNFPLAEPIMVAGKANRRLGVQVYNFDPTLAPPGKTVLKTQFNTDFDYWQKLREDPARYQAEKEQIADQVVDRLDKRFPGLAAQVEMRDVATPMTWVRYTGNWRGSYEGWLPKNMAVPVSLRKTLPGLKSFYMAGQWVEPGGGLPTAAMSGRNVAQLVCHQDKRPFVTTRP